MRHPLVSKKAKIDTNVLLERLREACTPQRRYLPAKSVKRPGCWRESRQQLQCDLQT